MTDFWQDLLEQQASLFNSFDLQSNNYFTPLEEMGVLQVAGDDAESFLQNLLTNDVAALAVNQAQLSGFCNAKGRLFALFLLVRLSDGYQILLPKTMCELLQQRLTMYVLRSKVTVRNESENLCCVGIISPTHTSEISIQSIVHPNDSNRFISVFAQNKVGDLINEFTQQGLQLAPQNSWEQLDINAGLAMVWPESKEKFTPQQVNLDLVNGLSFSKGCYPGQEVVARLHYLGKPSRRLFIAKAKTNLLPNIADDVITDNGSVAGHVVSALLIEGSVNLLLSLKLTSSASPLLLKDGSSILLRPSAEIVGD
ncbi:MAG: YgfZ/GcvT domain-containing protein [Methylophagaceae bacterium]